MLHIPLRFPAVGEQKKASRRGGESQQRREQLFQVGVRRLNRVWAGAVLLEPFTPVGGCFRIGGEYEDAIPVGRSKPSLGGGSHPPAHAGGYALRNIKSENSLFLFSLSGNPLRVGETKNQEQKNNGSRQDDEQPLLTDAQPEERQAE